MFIHELNIINNISKAITAGKVFYFELTITAQMIRTKIGTMPHNKGYVYTADTTSRDLSAHLLLLCDELMCIFHNVSNLICCLLKKY